MSVCVGMHMWCVGRDRGREARLLLPLLCYGWGKGWEEETDPRKEPSLDLLYHTAEKRGGTP